MCGCSKLSTTSPSNPLLVGEPNGVVTRVKSTLNFRGLKPGAMAWVTGSNVDILVAQRTLVVVA